MSPNAIRIAGMCGITVLVVIQFFRPPRTNPPSDPASSFEAVLSPHPDVSAAVRGACMDCHSNETSWPWYSNISPVSWLISHDVVDGRAHLNLSEWSFYSPERSRSRIAEMCTEVRDGKMPMWQYTTVHPKARMSEQTIARLCALARVERASLR
jgi:hypothetical protein